VGVELSVRGAHQPSPATHPLQSTGMRAEHRHALDAMIAKLLEKHGLKLRLNKVLDHNQK
jgi:hypothetical protein